MDDPEVVRRLERLGDLAGDRKRRGDGNWSGRNPGVARQVDFAHATRANQRCDVIRQ